MVDSWRPEKSLKKNKSNDWEKKSSKEALDELKKRKFKKKKHAKTLKNDVWEKKKRIGTITLKEEQRTALEEQKIVSEELQNRWLKEKEKQRVIKNWRKKCSQ